MDEEALARVFEPYFSTKTTGTGLGLPIARRNVELSGGTIEVESDEGRGHDGHVACRLPIGHERIEGSLRSRDLTRVADSRAGASDRSRIVAGWSPPSGVDAQPDTPQTT